MSVKAMPFDKKILTGIADSQQEPAWLRRLREEGLNRYNEQPLPKLDKTKIDKWNIDDFTPVKEEKAIDSYDLLPDEIKNLVEDGSAGVIVQKNGTVIFSQLNDQLKDKGVILSSLSQAVKEQEDLVQGHLFKSGVTDHKLTSLHQALWSGGVFIYVPKNVEVSEPIHVFQCLEGDSLGMLPHMLVIADVNSSVVVAENVIETKSQSSVMNGMVEVFAKDGARVNFSSVRSLGVTVTDYIYRTGVTGTDSSIQWALGDMNHGNTVTNTQTFLKGKGSNTKVYSVAIGNGKQKENFVSHVIHEASHTDSDILSKGVMFGESIGIFNGITKIEKGAEKSNGQQAEKLLIISEKARGDANPILLIDEDDVMAGHAASAGPVDENQLYYLMSRGISRQDAERLMIHGFLSPVIDLLPGEKMKTRLNTLIEGKLSI